MNNGILINPEENKTYSESEAFAVIEACLFAAGHPLSYARLAEVLSITASECKDTVSKMEELYNTSTDMPRGVILVTYPDSCQLCTKESFGPEIKKALGIKRGGNLSQSLLEVLAVIAYNQPTTRSFIDTVRGVDSSYAIGSLIDKNMIEACGKLDAPGRPTLYKTTTDFLRVFGLSTLTDLPSVSMKGEGGEQITLEPDLLTLNVIENETQIPLDAE